jgi:hypothetical protein
MSRKLLRAAAAGVVALLAGLLTAPAAQADIRIFPDVAGHITGVRVSHGPRAVAITAYDAEMTLGTYYYFWIDTDSSNPGPEYKAEVYPNSDGIFLKRVGNFASSGIIIRRCRGLRAIADVFGEDYAKVWVPRSCIGAPPRVRVAVVAYYDENNDQRIDVVDWAPGEERFYSWVSR